MPDFGKDYKILASMVSTQNATESNSTRKEIMQSQLSTRIYLGLYIVLEYSYKPGYCVFISQSIQLLLDITPSL